MESTRGSRLFRRVGFLSICGAVFDLMRICDTQLWINLGRQPLSRHLGTMSVWEFPRENSVASLLLLTIEASPASWGLLLLPACLQFPWPNLADERQDSAPTIVGLIWTLPHISNPSLVLVSGPHLKMGPIVPVLLVLGGVSVSDVQEPGPQ